MSGLHRNRLFNTAHTVAVVTGGGSGLGLVIARALAANGATAVYVIGRRKDVLDRAAALHDNIHALPGDVTSKDSLQQCAATVASRHDGIDVLVANAGANPGACVAGLPAGRPERIEDFVDAMWDVPIDAFNKAWEVNVTGVFYTALAFLPLLHARNAAGRVQGAPTPQILVTSSIAAHSRIVTGRFAYCASKAAVTHLAKQLATYLAGWKIRVNVLAPGLFATEMTADRGGVDKGVEGAVGGSVIPVERWGSEEDVAGAALFMLSRAGAYLDGSVMLLDGGRLSVAPATY